MSQPAGAGAAARGSRVLLPVLGPVAAVLVAAAAAGFATLELVEVRTLPGPVREPAPQPLPGGDRPPGTGSPGGGVLPVLLVMVVLAVAALAAWLGWRRLRRGRGRRRWFRLRSLRTPVAGRAAAPEQLAAAVAAAEERLGAADDPDPRRAVIACWVRLTEAAAEAGFPQYGSDTATDLVVRLLRSHRVSEPVLAAFVEAYWLARYATHPVDEQLRNRARSALRSLHAELRGTPAGAEVRG